MKNKVARITIWSRRVDEKNARWLIERTYDEPYARSVLDEIKENDNGYRLREYTGVSEGTNPNDIN